MLKYILIAIILLITILLFNIYNRQKENYDNVNMDIGNVLSDYYYQIVESILNQTDFNYSKKNFHDNKSSEFADPFMDNFPSHLPFDEEMYNKLTMNGITTDILDIFSVGYWVTLDKKKELLHKIMKPKIHKIFNNAFIKLNLKKKVPFPVIHFRCADTPFSKDGFYYFQKYSFFDKALDDLEMKLGKIEDITILACFDHLSNKKNKESCNKYVVKLVNYLKDYKVHVDCNSNVDDFVTMFYAPAVISTNSSFSFMAGYFGSGIYIQPNMMDSNIEKCLDCEADYRNYNIPHDKVNDYHNIEEVSKLLHII